MAQGEADTTIYGSRLTWEVGILLAATGELDPNYPTYISSGFVAVDGGKVLTYTGPAADTNDVPFTVSVAEYDANYNFIQRSYIYYLSGHYDGLQLSANCKYIRLQFGHVSSTGVNMNVSDGASVICLVQDRSEVKNGFVDGSYTHGSSAATISNNTINITAFPSGAGNSQTFRYKYPLNIQIGDTIRLVIQKVSGSMSSNTFVDATVGGNWVANNKNWSNTQTIALDESSTSTTDNNETYVVIQTRSTSPTFTNYTCRIKVYVNGVQVLPEV